MQVAALWIMVIMCYFKVLTSSPVESNKKLIRQTYSETQLKNIALAFKRALHDPRLRVKEKEFEAREEDIVTLQIEMNWLIKCLTSFVQEETFDTQGFESLVDRIDKQILYLFQLFEAAAPKRVRLSSQSNLSKALFYFMLRCMRLLDYYSIDSSMDQTLCYKVIKVNLNIMSLFELHGVPDPTVNGYTRIVESLSNKVNEWKKLAENFTEINDASKDTLKALFFHTEKTLRYLEFYIGVTDPEQK